MNTDWKNTFPNVPESFQHKVRATLAHLPEKGKEQTIMATQTGKLKWKKRIVAALAATMLLGTTVFAGGKISSIISRSDFRDRFTSFPTQQQMQKEIGVSPKLIEHFQNGYSFREGVVIKSALQDQTGNNMREFKEINLTYQRQEKQIDLYLKASDIQKEIEADESASRQTTPLNCQGIDLDYTQYTNKVVPPDYKMTQEDRKAQESGNLVFSYGADDISVHTVRTVEWIQENVSYSIQSLDNGVNKEDLLSMAEELITLKRK